MTKAKSNTLSTQKAGSPKRPSTRASMARFLDLFRRVGVVGAAARATGVDRTTVWAWRERYPRFSREFDEALEDALAGAEAEAIRRGQTGYLEDVYFKGAVVGSVRKYSDVLLLALLKAKRPAVWGTATKVELSGEVSLSSIDAKLAVMDTASKLRLRQLLVQDARTHAENAELRALKVQAGLEREAQ